MSFSEEWHEAQIRRLNREKLIAIEKTLKEFDHLYRLALCDINCNISLFKVMN